MTMINEYTAMQIHRNKINETRQMSSHRRAVVEVISEFKAQVRNRVNNNNRKSRRS